LWNFELASDKGTNTAYFGCVQVAIAKLITVCRHDCAVKYMTATRALTGGILKMLNLFEILPGLFGRQTVSVSCSSLPATNAAYLVGFRGRRKLTAIRPKFTAENCGPYIKE